VHDIMTISPRDYYLLLKLRIIIILTWQGVIRREMGSNLNIQHFFSSTVYSQAQTPMKCLQISRGQALDISDNQARPTDYESEENLGSGPGIGHF